MSFKQNQKVRIKGTGIEGSYKGGCSDGSHSVYATDGGWYYLPLELIEAVSESITVTFDPVAQDNNKTSIKNIFNSVTLSVRNDGDREYVTMDSSEQLRGNSFTHPEARKLALAILTITDGAK